MIQSLTSFSLLPRFGRTSTPFGGTPTARPVRDPHVKPHSFGDDGGGRALSMAAIGPGRLAVDRFFRWGAGGWAEAAFALGLGGLAAALTLSL